MDWSGQLGRDFGVVASEGVGYKISLIELGPEKGLHQ